MGIALSLPVAQAHANLTSSEPAAQTVVAAPTQVTLRFSEAVETAFSVFKVYALELSDASVLPTDATSSDDPAWLRLNGLAASVVSENLTSRQDGSARVDLPQTRSSTQEEVVLELDTLVPGAYVVMWRVLSTDTHTTQGSFVFVVED